MEKDLLLLKKLRRSALLGRRKNSAEGEKTPGLCHVLDHLDRESGKSQQQLAEELGIRPQSVSESVALLEKRGDLVRTVHPQDRRVTLITLTEAGEERRELARQRRAERAERLFRLFTEEEKDLFCALLEKIELAAEKEDS